jgi:hypothetical protein
MPKLKTAWTAERVARLSFLVGQGFAAKRVADDPLIASTPNNVHRQAQRFDLALRDSKGAALRLPPEAAGKRGMTREAIHPHAAHPRRPRREAETRK